jgi:hypothetical protein
MASSISAGTTSSTALVATSDTSGILALQSNNGTTGLTLNASQALGVGSTPSYGTSGQVLTSAGSAASPTWATPAGLTSGTAVASTSGTSIDFTSLPSTVKRITISFAAVSTNGGSNLLVQLGAGSVQTSGYTCATTYVISSVSTQTSSAGFAILNVYGSALVLSGIMTLTLVNSATGIWASSHTMQENTSASIIGGGDKTLSGTLDRVRITTVNGTDTFDAGFINILYE